MTGDRRNEEQLARLSYLVKLVTNFMDAKEDEKHARDNRIAIEEKIAALVPTPEKGQKTITVGNVKLTVKRDLSYKADLDGIRRIWANSELPVTGILAPIKSQCTCMLNVESYEWYREYYPDVFKKLAKYVEVKPKKVAISVTVK